MARIDCPRRGSMIKHADQDFICFGVLFAHCMIEEAYYHATQSIEKYLKTLALSIFDPNEEKSGDEWIKFLKGHSHKLWKLGEYCATHYPKYGEAAVMDNLRKYTDYDQTTRYPWVESPLVKGFMGTEANVMFELVKLLRNDIPIQRDDYPLGILLRGCFHGSAHNINDPISVVQMKAVEVLRELFSDLDSLIRK